jgi:hypothetical protein
MTAPTLMRLRKAAARLKGELPAVGPNFFIVGATRAGTTYLHHALRAHPDIFLPEVKELQYFNRDDRYRADLKGYRERFWGYAGETAIGEATPLYMTARTVYDGEGKLRYGVETDAIERIATHFPDARLVISLRDPATRIPSIYEKNLRQRKLDTLLADLLEEELDGRPSMLNLLYLNDYRTHLENVLRRFPSGQVMVTVFEEWRRDPATAVEQLQRFLGVEPSFREPEIREATNRRERYGELDEQQIKRLSAVSEAQMAAVLKSLGPSRTWLEELMGRKLPWQ